MGFSSYLLCGLHYLKREKGHVSCGAGVATGRFPDICWSSNSCGRQDRAGGAGGSGARKCWASKDTFRSGKTTHRMRGDFCRSYYLIRGVFLVAEHMFLPKETRTQAGHTDPDPLWAACVVKVRKGHEPLHPRPPARVAVKAVRIYQKA